MSAILDIVASKWYHTPEMAKGIAGQQVMRNRLRVARAERDISQDELAGLVGVTRQTISAVETGQYCPSTKLALALAAKLGKKVEDLFYLEGNDG